MVNFKYRPDVDGLRAVAVALVLLFHTGLGFSGGFVGVDVFFVISGFLITGLILKEQQAGTFSLRAFWVRRVKRIIPASSFTVFATLLAGASFLFPLDYEELARSATSQQLMLSNMYFLRNTRYFGDRAELMPLLHTWSLAVEEQFYLLYPFFLAALPRLKIQFAGSLIAAAAVSSFLVSEWGARHHPSHAFFLLPTRAWEMLLGGLICFTPIALNPVRMRMELLSALGLAAILISAWCYSDQTPFPGVAALVPCLGAVCFIYSNVNNLTFTGKLLAIRPVVFIGLMSYSIYLWHWPILVYSRYWLGAGMQGVFRPTLALLASVACGYMSWRFVETPFRRSKTKHQSLLLVSIGLTVPLLLLFSVVITYYKGFPNRFPTRAVEYHSAKLSNQFKHDLRSGHLKRNEVPTFGAKEGTLKCMVWGDSHAMALVPGIDDACRTLNIKGFQVTRALTPPIMNFEVADRPGAREFNASAIQYAIEKRIDIVILGGYWSLYSNSPSFEGDLGKTVEKLSDLGIEVAVVLDVAHHEDDVPLELARRVVQGVSTNNLGVRSEDYLAANLVCNEAISRVVAGKARILNPAALLTDANGVWAAEIDELVLYRDQGHLSVAGGLRLSPMFKEFLISVREKR